MLLIKCPYCKQERSEIEFSYAGEAHIERPADPSATSDKEWEAFLFMRANSRDIIYERWCHVHGCAQYFNAVRDAVSEKIILTYKAGQPRPDPQEIAALKNA